MLSNDLFYHTSSFIGEEVVIKSDNSESDQDVSCKEMYDGLFPTAFMVDDNKNINQTSFDTTDESLLNDLSPPTSNFFTYSPPKETGCSMYFNTLPDEDITSDQDNYDIEPDIAKKPVIHKCAICMFRTEYIDELKEHVVDHIGGPDNETYVEFCMKEDKYNCFLCQFTSYSVDKFLIHTAQHKSQTPVSSTQEFPQTRPEPNPVRKTEKKALTLYKCKTCKYASYNEKQILKHQLIHTKKNPFVCPSCSFGTGSSKAYNVHLESHQFDRKFPCTKCDYRGRTKSGLNQHKQTHMEPRFKCSFCTYRSCKQARIVRHERTHTGEKPYKCPYCDNSFNQDGTLSIHIRRHTGDRPYECNSCSFTTISGSSLKTHQKKHNTEKHTYECNVCHQVYLSPGSLKIHMKSHNQNVIAKGAKKEASNKRPAYRCKECNFRCSTFDELDRHTQTHVEEESPVKKRTQPVHQCLTCGLTFNRRRALRFHEETHAQYDQDQNTFSESGNRTMTMPNMSSIQLGGYVLRATEND